MQEVPGGVRGAAEGAGAEEVGEGEAEPGAHQEGDRSGVQGFWPSLPFSTVFTLFFS